MNDTIRKQLLKEKLRKFSRELVKQEARGSLGLDEVKDIKEAMQQTLEKLVAIK